MCVRRYVPAMCAVGWFLAGEGASNSERLHDLLLVAVLETVVAAAAILYCQLLMPLFFMVNAWLQLAWVCLLHPIYFEVTTAVLVSDGGPLRTLLPCCATRCELTCWKLQCTRARAAAHRAAPQRHQGPHGRAMVPVHRPRRRAQRQHLVHPHQLHRQPGRRSGGSWLTLNGKDEMSVQSQLDRQPANALRVLLFAAPVAQLTQVLCSAAKLVWRSTTNLRDIWIERIRHQDFSYNHGFHEQCQQNRLVATGILTEMILENACNVLAPWLIWCTWHVPLFMSVAPTTLIDGGEYPVYYVICLILILVVVSGASCIAPFPPLAVGRRAPNDAVASFCHCSRLQITATFDVLFLVSNYMWGQQLPVIQTFREIRANAVSALPDRHSWASTAQGGGPALWEAPRSSMRKAPSAPDAPQRWPPTLLLTRRCTPRAPPLAPQVWYVGFLAYALTFMGIMFLFITMILVPRAVFCSSNNYCDCRIQTLQGICEGEYISTWGGNII